MKKYLFISLGILLLSALCGFAWQNLKKNNAMKTTSFSGKYEKNWDKIDSLLNIGQPKTALEEIQKIMELTDKNQEHADWLRALMFKMKTTSQYEENYINAHVLEIQGYLKTKPAPIKQVLHSFLATLYWDYYTNNSWRIQNRSITKDFNNQDIQTWDFEKFILACHENYQLSLENSEVLQKIKIQEYQIILTSNESFNLRPTLYDFLVHRAIDFYRSSEIDLNNASNQFKLNELTFLKDAETFSKITLKTQTEFSYKYETTRLLQNLLRFRLQQGELNALVDADLKRLEFVYSYVQLADKDPIYLETLQKIANNNHESSARANHQIAQHYYTKSDYVKAFLICQISIDKYPTSEGGINCKALQSRILEKSLALQTEQITLPNEAILAKINHRNVNKIFVKVVPLTENEQKNFDVYQKEFSSLSNFSKSNTLVIDLPTYADYKSHETEFKIPAQMAGNYMILVASSDKFTKQEAFVSYQELMVTDVSILNQENNEIHEFFILSRKTGLPLPNKKVEVYEQKYSRTKREYEYEKKETTKTDVNGYFKLACSEKGENIYLKVFNTESDIYWNEQNYSLYKNRYFHQSYNTRSHIFTDRKIYRPSQLIYFKGIVIDYEGENYQKRTIVANKEITVILNDPNHQKVAEIQVKTNDYGTYSGTFTIPTGKLTGNYTIEDNFGSLGIKVEEYKRPTFETTILPIEGQFRLNDKISVTGNAKSFSGAVVDQASVKYSIIREVHFPYWCAWWRPAPSAPAVTIINAATTTDEIGNFKFDFTAFPDESTNLNDNPVFTYKISVDVTDLNGETRSTTYHVSVSNKALSLSTNVPTELEKVDKTNLLINATNLQGQAIPTSGTILIEKLKIPTKAYQNRLWEKAEKITLSKEDFEKEFPYSYDDVENQDLWKTEKEALKSTFNTANSKEITLKIFDKIGVYRITVTAKDIYNQEVKSVQYVTIHDSENKNLTLPTHFSVKALQTSVEPNEKAHFLVGSSDNIRVLYEIEHGKKIIHREWISLNNEQKKLSIPIKEEYRGNLVARFISVSNNRVYSESETIIVPYSNKELDISFETFRDKLQPGEKEQWKLKIKGKNGDKVGAEFLATLYDASLDAFAVNNWYLSIYGTYYAQFSWNNSSFEQVSNGNSLSRNWNQYASTKYHNYYQLDWDGYQERYNYAMTGSVLRSNAMEKDSPRPTRSIQRNVKAAAPMMEKSKKMESPDEEMIMEDSAAGAMETEEEKESETTSDKSPQQAIQARTNFNETAFFFPHLETDSEGSIIINFTIPESLTRWKMLGLAHTKDLKIGTIQNQLVTQKELMITANAPRFFRENDIIYFTAKINNLSDKTLSGTSVLELSDAISTKNIDAALGNTQHKQAFEVKAGQSTVVTWQFKVNDVAQAITYKVTASAANFTDGEQKTLPVLTNRMLVTETMPLWIRGKETKEITFKNFEKTSSTTLKQHQFTLEFTANPTWYAVQSLPYLMEYPYECAEQTFSRLYANSISSHIINKHPIIKDVFKKWENLTPDAFLSNLEKNQELKSAILEETPWVLQAKDESARKRRIAVLFDINRMANEEEKAIKRLQQLQMPSGAWSWFKGMYEDRYVTQHIVTGAGKLRKMGVENPELIEMSKKAILYLDEQLLKDYQWLKKHVGEKDMAKKQVSYMQIHYLYMRSFFPEIPLKNQFQEAYNYYFGQTQKFWTSESRYMQGMIAIVLDRSKDLKNPALIVRSLNETALHSEEMGMYWKDTYGYYWYQAPVETQALMIEVYDEVAKDAKAVEELKIWLLKNKQTNDWKTTKATVEACYVLLSKGDDWLANNELPTVEVGNYEINYKGQAPKTTKKAQHVSVEAGTGYFKTTWNGNEIDKSMGTIKVQNPNSSIAWGGIYWQYFEQLDKITPSETPLSLKKQLFVERKTADKVTIEPVTENTILQTGDRIKVRIELRVDRAMEYVHMKDMRASGFEPENVLSQYKYQDGLGYYESTKDASTNFFFSYLNKGTYVFEYALRVTHAGDFSNGITSIQCMYAPEFSSHSEGIRVKIKK